MQNEAPKGIKILREKACDFDITHDYLPPLETKSHTMSQLETRRLFPPIIYVILSAIVFFSLVIIFYTHVLRLKVETAVVGGQIETMIAPLSGYITEVYVHSGERVKKGTALLKIENIDLERELQLARATLDESRLIIEYDQQLLINEQQRLKIYQKIGNTRVDSAQTQVNISKQKVITAKQNLNRYKALHKKHYVSESSLETMHATYLNALEKLKNSQAQQHMENHSLHAIVQGMYFTGTKTEGIGRDLIAELEHAKKTALINAKRVTIYEQLMNKLILKAPFDGTVTQILKSAGNTTDNSKPIIFIENNQASKRIVAYLTQDEIIHVGASSKVKIYLPSTGKTYNGKIIAIDRTDGFIDLIKAQYRWRNSQVDRSAIVTIAMNLPKQKKSEIRPLSGTPAIVYFSKQFIPL